MADNKGNSSKVNIPKLDEKNFLHWLMRIKAHLRHKGLLKYITEPPVPLSGAAAEAVNKKHAETFDILMNYMSETAFESVITPENKENPHGIWTQIISRYASTSVNNKGRVWLKFMRYEYGGNLKEFISDMHRLLTEIALVKLGVPENILSFSILSKLSEDLWNVVDNIIMNEVLIKSPNTTLTKLQELVHLEESRKKKVVDVSPRAKTEEPSESASALIHKSEKGKKKTSKRGGPICEKGQHNPEVKSHTADFCWQIHPHLKIAHDAKFNNKAKPVEKPATQLVEVDDGHESEASLLLVEAKSKPIVLDSGATHHMINDPSVFFPSAKTNMKISTGGHSNFLTATSVGSVVLVNHQGRKKTLNNVLLVPTLSRSLLSIPRMFKEKFCIEKLHNHEVTIDIDNKFQLLGTMKNNLLELLSSSFDAIKSNSSCYQASPENPNWHERLGHLNHQYLKQLIPEAVEHECDICKQCKLRALPFSGNFKNVHQVLDAVHLDLVGPFPVQSPAGYMYFLTIVDQFSGFKSVKFLRSKGETFDKFVDFKNNAEKQTGKTLRMIISNGGGEFVNEKFSQMCSSEGIAQHITPAYTPQNNGMAERANQSILVKARCLLVQSKLPKSLWTEAVNTATHLCNLTPSRTRGMRIPYNVWTGKSVSLDVLRPFGCRTYSLIPKEKREFKLNPTAEPGIMLGYENDFSTYRIYKLNKKIVVCTRDVKFDESVFPGLGGNHDIQPSDDIFDVSNHQEPAPNTGQESSNSTEPTAVPVADETHDQSVPTRVAPKDISSSISTDNILSVDRRGNSIIVYLTENVEDDTPKSYIQAINSANSSQLVLVAKLCHPAWRLLPVIELGDSARRLVPVAENPAWRLVLVAGLVAELGDPARRVVLVIERGHPAQQLVPVAELGDPT
ncbi:hypothetical protein PCANC_26631 [Puccinia coronata f. sp. avenae]|uniref:Integrase catalytic domain-containing protein n=1 Tax=Puccinia coronata f. sp. avenae TaxID=200324 RepID=A0A2N5TL67_9BASI|nr:hypothetical protein PCANC_26631 [Puccinia coronata f. sp. avenae]